MRRSAFLKRMAFAAMACAFFDVPVPGLGATETDPFLGFGVVVPPSGDYVLGTTVHVPSDVALDWCDSRITFSDDGRYGRPALRFHGRPHPETRIHRNVFDGAYVTTEAA